MEKLIITAAITGGAPPQGNPYLPKTPKLQIQAAVDACNAGASVIHIHARNPVTGEGDHKARYFAEAIAGIRKRCSAIINVTTGGETNRVDGDWLYKKVPERSVKGRLAVIPRLCKNTETKPEMAPLNAGSPVIDIYSRQTKRTASFPICARGTGSDSSHDRESGTYATLHSAGIGLVSLRGGSQRIPDDHNSNDHGRQRPGRL